MTVKWDQVASIAPTPVHGQSLSLPAGHVGTLRTCKAIADTWDERVEYLVLTDLPVNGKTAFLKPDFEALGEPTPED